MNNRIVLINVILVAVILAESFMVIRLWSAEDTVVTAAKKASSKTSGAHVAHSYSSRNMPPLSSYVDITKYNLFSPERQEYIPEVREVVPEPKEEVEAVITELTTDKIKLYGIIRAGDYRKALVSNFEKKGDRSSVWVKEGEKIDGFLLSSIEKDRLIVANGGKKYSVLLYDDKKPKQRQHVQKKVTTKVIKPKPKKNNKSSPAKKKGGEKALEEGYEIISTPFGEFKRKKQ